MQFERFADEIGLTLEPFQRRIAKAAKGREREFVVLIPRGNGKTTLLAAIALHHLVTVEGAAVYCAASSREQARILYEAAAAFARRLDDEHVIVRHPSSSATATIPTSRTSSRATCASSRPMRPACMA